MGPTNAGPVARTALDYHPYTARKAPLMSTTTPVVAEEVDDDVKEEEVEEEEHDKRDEGSEYGGGGVQVGSRKVRDGLKTDAYEDRPAFGIPRVRMTKRELLHIRKHALLTTDAFDDLEMSAKKAIMITNKEVAALEVYRASQGQTWKYTVRNKKKELWMQLTDERCWKYEVFMNDKIMKHLNEGTKGQKRKKSKRGGDEVEEYQESRQKRARQF
ncbi:hypothetical protein BKA65DRAFT_204999 [Rhexocercosporidium sp. MPI-PUGE-AT-0058]|nr:hypothetical protein BKA65DRAFT_204999 [Rhexocercosporidium sp. MPI-PUGE-AT-0058]